MEINIRILDPTEKQIEMLKDLTKIESEKSEIQKKDSEDMFLKMQYMFKNMIQEAEMSKQSKQTRE